MSRMREYLIIVIVTLCIAACSDDVGSGKKFRETDLIVASRMGDIDKVRSLIKENSEQINQQDSFGDTALTTAIEEKHENVANLLLEAGADVNLETSSGGTALYYAVLNNDLNLVNKLLELGANINAREDNRSLLFWAVEIESISLINLLIENQIDIREEQYEYGYPLHLAVEKGRLDIVELLVENGANIKKVDRGTGRTALMEAIASPPDAYFPKIASYLLDKGADPNVYDRYSVSALVRAIERKDKNLVQRMLEKGADVVPTLGSSTKPIEYAAKIGEMEIVKLLEKNALKKGVKPEWHLLKDNNLNLK